jgi:hypothetical protein
MTVIAGALQNELNVKGDRDVSLKTTRSNHWGIGPGRLHDLDENKKGDQACQNPFCRAASHEIVSPESFWI